MRYLILLFISGCTFNFQIENESASLERGNVAETVTASESAKTDASATLSPKM